MSNAMLNIFVRVVKRRVEQGENIDDILDGFTNLSDEEKETIKSKI